MVGRRAGAMVGAVLAAVVLIAAACSNSSGSGGGGSSDVSGSFGTGPIVVGSLATESGSLAGQFGTTVNGAKAYFDYVNAHGGVDGRKIELNYSVDDTGSPTNDTTQARNLVEQDHVFAVVAVGTPFFTGSTFLASQGVPTFGYVVSQDWNNHPSLFGAYGSYLDYTTSQPVEAYLAQQLHSKSVAVVAYSIAASSKDACASVVQGLQKRGIHVGFQDLSFGLGANPNADVLRMKAAGVDLFISCMEGSDNLAFQQSMIQNGMTGVHSVWLTGYYRPYVTANPKAMTGVIYLEQHVPFEAAAAFPGKYPAMQQYLAIMKKYEPGSVYDDIAFQGYLNAVQFVQGLREVAAAHLKLTQSNLVNTINKETDFTGGLTTPINWTNAHDSALPPYCSAFVEVESGGKLVPAFVQKNDEVFVCGNNNDQVVPAPAGTPGL